MSLRAPLWCPPRRHPDFHCRAGPAEVISEWLLVPNRRSDQIDPGWAMASDAKLLLLPVLPSAAQFPLYSSSCVIVEALRM